MLPGPRAALALAAVLWPAMVHGDPPRSTKKHERRFLLAIEAVGIQAPPLHAQVAHIDPRYAGTAVGLGGLGILGRFAPHPRIAVELTVRSGAVRHRDRDDDGTVSRDVFLADAGVLLFLARGRVGALALDGGVGGAYTLLRYDLSGWDPARQAFGSALLRAGLDGELLTKRIAFVFSLRTYGVVTDRQAAASRGALFADPDSRGAPVHALEVWVAAAAGIGYRF